MTVQEKKKKSIQKTHLSKSQDIGEFFSFWKQ